ncbi:hypothetical protein VNO80_07037 [Phaseolus coccineus]|uniref:Uncharacterized protein n=1 Tax=Phaseolus coccineus TaxID=3886 RepID=A0AAN9RJI8_PHACN
MRLRQQWTNLAKAMLFHVRYFSYNYSRPRVGGDSKLAPLDPTLASGNTSYYKDLLYKKGLLPSNQVLVGYDD